MSSEKKIDVYSENYYLNVISMFSPILPNEVEAIRTLFLNNPTPDDAAIASISNRPPQEIRSIYKQYQPLFLDLTISAERISETITSSQSNMTISVPTITISPQIYSAPTITIQPPQIISPSIISSSLPPKFRGKPFAKTPTATSSNPFSPIGEISSTFPEGTNIKFPHLPMMATQVSIGNKEHKMPEIGSLAAIVHPNLGPAHVCRVLASQMQNGKPYYLVSFFQNDPAPCYVFGDYLFQLEDKTVFPLSPDESFDQQILSQNISVDWLLEKIFSGAQNLVMSHASVLFQQDLIESANIKPQPQQFQQALFQCITYAALILTCYIAGKFSVPKEKLEIIIATIIKTNPPRFVSTQNNT